MIQTKTVKTPESRCPACGIEIDSATNIGLNSPSPGDYSVCIGCQEVPRFNKDLTVYLVDASSVPDYLKEQVRKIRQAARTIAKR